MKLVARTAACLALIAATSALLSPAASAARTVEADRFTLETRPLERGQVELLTISSPPRAVSGGDTLVEVRGLTLRERLRVKRNGRDVSDRFEPSGEIRQGLVAGLREGRNRIIAVARGKQGRRRAKLRVRNHPTSGPIVSGPHQEPFFCETDDSGLGPALDEDCSIETRYDWYYRSTDDQAFHRLEDPYEPYPGDAMSTTTSDGETVPFVVRVETATINRGIARIAVLDDPASRGRDAPFSPSWNQRLTYAFGESCGVGYRQGENRAQSVLGGLPGTDVDSSNAFAMIYGLADRLGEGDAVAISTMTTYGVYCNPLVSAETLMMMNEHITEAYGPIERTIGVGASGGALQQYNAANGYPGLLDGAIPVASFTDVTSTAMTVVDCGLLTAYFERSSISWSDEQRAAVAGHRTSRICLDWVDLFLPRIDPTDGCSGEVPREVRYDADTNPDGVRCSLQDAVVNLLGRDPETGFARRPYDNFGVQYGLGALNAGVISPRRFIDLNREVGGYDLDANPIPQRSRMSRKLARRIYRLGGIVGRGPLSQTPFIDLASYLDLVPVADIHDVIRPFQVRARLRLRGGSDDSQSIWRGLSTPPDAREAMDAWLDEIDRSTERRRVNAVAASRPPAAEDRCIVAAAGAKVELPEGITLPLGAELPLAGGLTGEKPLFSFPVGAFVPERQEAGEGACDTAFPTASATRMVAGGHLSDDVIKCRRKPVDPDDYEVRLTDAELAELRGIFPKGVCDWSRAGFGELRSSIVWPTIGANKLTKPRELRWTAARSRPGNRGG